MEKIRPEAKHEKSPGPKYKIMNENDEVEENPHGKCSSLFALAHEDRT